MTMFYERMSANVKEQCVILLMTKNYIKMLTVHSISGKISGILATVNYWSVGHV